MRPGEKRTPFFRFQVFQKYNSLFILRFSVPSFVYSLKLPTHPHSITHIHMNTAPLVTLSNATGISKLWLAGIGLLFTTIFLFFGLGANLLCNLVGFLYPAYESFKAIESGNREDNVQWLIYWVVFGCFHIAEIGIEILLAWFPFYYAFKLGFLVYCFLPSTRGAQFVYGNIIKPFLETHQVRFDNQANSINEELYGSVRFLLLFV